MTKFTHQSYSENILILDRNGPLKRFLRSCQLFQISFQLKQKVPTTVKLYYLDY